MAILFVVSALFDHLYRLPRIREDGDVRPHHFEEGLLAGCEPARNAHSQGEARRISAHHPTVT